MSKIPIASILLGVLSLTGCTYSSHFDCPVAEGSKCTALAQNDKKIAQGEYEQLPPSEIAADFKECFYFREDFDR
ncbi:MAG: hypothetical protein ABFQ95_08275 [Pseudomonadota bacterium]